MGLDTVELVMSVEERFGISISDPVAERVMSVGDLFVLVCQLTGAQASIVCPSAAGFRALRRDMPMVGRHRPGQSIDTAVPRRHRREIWDRLEAKHGKSLPKLTWRRHWAYALGLALLAAVTGFLCMAAVGSTYGMTAFLLGVPIAVGLWLVGTATADQPPHNVATLGDLARRWPLPKGSWTPNGVWPELRRLVSEQVGISEENITSEKQFVRDLNMD